MDTENLYHVTFVLQYAVVTTTIEEAGGEEEVIEAAAEALKSSEDIDVSRAIDIQLEKAI